MSLGKALRKARGVVGVAENRDEVAVVMEEISRGYSRYRLAQPTHGRLRLPDFVAVCQLGARAEQWLKMSPVTFHPFDAQSPGETVVIEAALSAVSPPLTWRVVDLLVAHPPP